ncbi:MAG TPA: helix-turn-helix transcriptional regulator [Sphingomicrobium sp.]|nr:helix-turn-helix transcriptional regulator [Sphingomicrobium sp.]
MNSAAERVRPNTGVGSFPADALTQGQIECLLLVGEHFTSKEIASTLRISRHTVDQRIRLAMRKLGVQGRREAARIVLDRYGPMFRWGSGAEEPFVVNAVAPARPSPNSLHLPFATRLRPSNEMNLLLRLVWIVAIGFGAAAAAGMYLAGLESFGRLLAQ